MKKLKVKKDATCMACLECVRACSEAYYKVFDPAKSVIQIVDKKGDAKPVVCPQCGKCAEACPNKAINKNAKGVFTVDKKLCDGCGKCVEACPFNLMIKVDDKPNSSKCIACGICVKSCPMDVLEIVEDDK